MGALDISGREVIFIDDYLIEQKVNIQRTLHQPIKYVGNPIMRPVARWEGHSVNLFGTVLKDEGIYKMWYQGYGGTPYTGCYATSRDGIFWERPNLGLIEYEGSKDNNIFLIDISPVNVMKDERETNPDRRYKALFWEQHNPSMSVAFSPDGINWSKYEGNPVIENTGDVHMLAGWDESCGKYVVYSKPRQASDGRRIRVVTRLESEDFIHWSEPVYVLEPDEKDPPNLEFYGMPVFKYGDIYIGLPSVYHTYEEEPNPRMAGTMNIQLAYSRDGYNWNRACDRKVFIPNGPPGSVDSKMIYCARAPVDMEDELWFYYGGYLVDHGITEDINGKRPNDLKKQGGIIAQRGGYICLAKLRKSGFVSLDAGEEEGYIVTKPFICKGDELFINADAKGGYIAVSVLDEDGHHFGNYFTGYKRVECALFDGNSIHHRVTWRDKVSLTELKGKTIKLKFYLKNAMLYSFVCSSSSQK
ncbi:MAG: hypothetical protein HPY74_08700 [Firmicutes bacterium]|nr:hypothetical protein [Bacillota bacterium]